MGILSFSTLEWVSGHHHEEKCFSLLDCNVKKPINLLILIPSYRYVLRFEKFITSECNRPMKSFGRNDLWNSFKRGWVLDFQFNKKLIWRYKDFSHSHNSIPKCMVEKSQRSNADIEWYYLLLAFFPHRYLASSTWCHLCWKKMWNVMCTKISRAGVISPHETLLVGERFFSRLNLKEEFLASHWRKKLSRQLCRKFWCPWFDIICESCGWASLTTNFLPSSLKNLVEKILPILWNNQHFMCLLRYHHYQICERY